MNLAVRYPAATLLLMLLIPLSPHLSASSMALGSLPAWLPPSGEVEFRLEGGVAPIQWQTISGQIEPLAERHYRYTAPRRFMVDRLRFIDATGEEIEHPVAIYRPLQASPGRRHLKRGELSADFSITGGSGQWQVEPAPPLQGVVDGKLLTVSIDDQAMAAIGQSRVEQLWVVDQVTGERVALDIQLVAPLGLSALPDRQPVAH